MFIIILFIFEKFKANLVKLSITSEFHMYATCAYPVSHICWRWQSFNDLLSGCYFTLDELHVYYLIKVAFTYTNQIFLHSMIMMIEPNIQHSTKEPYLLRNSSHKLVDWMYFITLISLTYTLSTEDSFHKKYQ